jgi:hypothetical protein
VSDTPVGCVLGCGRVARSHGLCVRHLYHARKAVARGETTWAQLEREGKARAAAPKKQLKFK